jgi:exosortase A-associated hydrolase 2
MSNRAVGPSGTETAFFFGDAGRRKYAVLHEPPETGSRSQPILLLHPHFEEKLWSQRVLVEASRAAAARGHTVLRFDFTGHGDSEGEFEEVGLTDLESDVDEAVALVEEKTGLRPVLVGLRLGGTLAGRAAGRLGGRAALWQPILDPEDWLQQTLRANLTFQLMKHGKVRKNRAALTKELEAGEAVLIEGYGLTSRFYREALESGRLGAPVFPARCEGVLAVEIRKAAGNRPSALEESVRKWSSDVPAVYRLVEEESFWTDVRRYRTRSSSLVALTLDWIEDPGVVEDGR